MNRIRCSRLVFVAISAALVATAVTSAPTWAMGVRGDVSQLRGANDQNGSPASGAGAAPEIDAGAAGAALALLAGGLAILRSRWLR